MVNNGTVPVRIHRTDKDELDRILAILEQNTDTNITMADILSIILKKRNRIYFDDIRERFNGRRR